jgi:hypothetical protein
MSSGAASGGLPSVLQAGGARAGFARSTIWLRPELRDSETEYGSVTRFVSTRIVDGCQTSTS